MRWLLDTNVLSELRKGRRCDANVRRWMEAHQDEELFTSALVMGEVRRGIEAKRRRDPEAAASLDAWATRILTDFGSRVLPVDSVIADRWGRLNVPDPIPAIDGLIAATALVHGLTLVTRNVRDVARSGVQWLDPFAAPPSTE